MNNDPSMESCCVLLRWCCTCTSSAQCVAIKQCWQCNPLEEQYRQGLVTRQVVTLTCGCRMGWCGHGSNKTFPSGCCSTSSAKATLWGDSVAKTQPGGTDMATTALPKHSLWIFLLSCSFPFPISRCFA